MVRDSEVREHRSRSVPSRSDAVRVGKDEIAWSGPNAGIPRRGGCAALNRGETNFPAHRTAWGIAIGPALSGRLCIRQCTTETPAARARLEKAADVRDRFLTVPRPTWHTGLEPITCPDDSWVTQGGRGGANRSSRLGSHEK